MSTHRGFWSRVVIPALPLLLAACSNMRTIQVAVAPRVDLAAYPTVGLITFSSNSGDPELARRATERFLAAVQEAQPGTRVVELGTEAEVLNEVHRSAVDAETLRAIQSSRGVAAVFSGRFDVSKTKPHVNVSAAWQGSVNVRADVDVVLSARLVETANTATVWTDSARRTENIASGGASQHGNQGTFGFEVRDLQEAYDGVIDTLVCEVTDAFRTHYVSRRVPKEDAMAGGAAGQ